MKNKKNIIKRSDYDRILISETLPFETPIIFSNDGLYNLIKGFEATTEINKKIINELVFDKQEKSTYTIPYLYKTKKNANEYRRLALLHPTSQWKLRCFYEKYQELILHYCSLSPCSIRAPEKVAGSFYTKSSWENLYQYKSEKVTLSELDNKTKHAPTFFSYRGYDRLYKFFNSKKYIELEKQYQIMMTLDVAKCFDSIYTHSLDWAVKSKSFTKKHVKISTTFAQNFDKITRHGNHNETHGIPIGPESSRIFAEMIFQDIDIRTINRLKDLKFGEDYTFYRYVDDVYIFAHDKKTIQKVYDVYSDVLLSFNLHTNKSKSSTFHRPFLTNKSQLIFEVSNHTNEFLAKLLVKGETGNLKPTKIFSKWNLTRNYIDTLKSLCLNHSSDYDEIATFVIAVLTARIKKIISFNNEIGDNTTEELYLDCFEILVELLFFLFSVAPSVGSSYKLSTSIILICRFAKKHLTKYSNTILHFIYTLSTQLLSEQSRKDQVDNIDGFVNLEYMNLMLALRELGNEFLIPPKTIENLFFIQRNSKNKNGETYLNLSYFTIISCLFYIKDDLQYSEIKNKILASVKEKLKDLSDIKIDSEKAYLFIDVIHCPYIPKSFKKCLIDKFYESLGIISDDKKPSNKTLEEFIKASDNDFWHTNWKEIDLLNSLEKKELTRVY